MAANSSSLKLGTRGSPLALAQADELRQLLVATRALTQEEVEIVVIRTSGDRITDRALADAGGKGLFTKELDEALLDGRIDIAVHSAKDLPTVLPKFVGIAGYLPREDARDALIAPNFGSLDKLPTGACIGTASVRREAQLAACAPISPCGSCVAMWTRGCASSRKARVMRRSWRSPGLKRLGRAHEASQILDVASFIPAVGQGAIAIATRVEDEGLVSRLAPVLDASTERALAAERAFLAGLDGSCRTPLAGHAVLEGGRLRFRGIALRQDGTDAVEVARDGALADAERVGAEAAAELLARLPPGILVARE